VAHFGPQNNDVVARKPSGELADPRVTIVYDDARHYILTTDEKFDIITSDPIHPWVKGAATLYTREYFDLVRSHLEPGGLVTQWVPLYESSPAVVKSEIATFFEAFPNGTIWSNEAGGSGYDVVLLGNRGGDDPPFVIDGEVLLGSLTKVLVRPTPRPSSTCSLVRRPRLHSRSGRGTARSADRNLRLSTWPAKRSTQGRGEDQTEILGFRRFRRTYKVSAETRAQSGVARDGSHSWSDQTRDHRAGSRHRDSEPASPRPRRRSGTEPQPLRQGQIGRVVRSDPTCPESSLPFAASPSRPTRPRDAVSRSSEPGSRPPPPPGH
jgi:hypothetical protein